MTRRRLLLFAAAACLLLAAPFVVRWATMPPPGVTLENFRRLHDRMSIEQIREILGQNHEQFDGQYRWYGEECTVELGKISVPRDEPEHELPDIRYFGTFVVHDGQTIYIGKGDERPISKICRWLGL